MTTEQPGARGPYDTCWEAYGETEDINHADARALHDDGAGNRDQINAGLLTAALRGVPLGHYDLEVLGELAELPPHKAQVLIGLFERCYASGRDQLAEEIAELHTQITALGGALNGHLPPVAVDIATARAIAERKAGR